MDTPSPAPDHSAKPKYDLVFALTRMQLEWRTLAMAALTVWQGLKINRDLPHGEWADALAGMHEPDAVACHRLLRAMLHLRGEVLARGSADEREKLAAAVELGLLFDALASPLTDDLRQALTPLAKLAHTPLADNADALCALALPGTMQARLNLHEPATAHEWEALEQAAIPLCLFWNDFQPTVRATKLASAPSPWLERQGATLFAYAGQAPDCSAVYQAADGRTLSHAQAGPRVLQALDALIRASSTREGDLAKLRATEPALARGVVLGDFLIGPPAGAGGFGTVHRGRQISTGRPVAVKILRDGMDADISARFRREAAFLARFRHRHIAAVLGAGEEEWVLPPGLKPEEEPWLAEFVHSAKRKSFYAMEWIEGRTLEAVYRAGRESGAQKPSLTDLTRWFAEGAGALAAVHAAGLLHRDLKPGNLMVDGEGDIRLLDFGIARPIAPGGTLATEAGRLLGTLAYMSPEQLRANAAEAGVGPASDIYGLCATFYELFTSQRLLHHDTQGAEALCTLKLSGQRPERPRTLAHGLPWELETLLMGGLESEPADRIGSMAALEDDLRRVLDNEPIRYRRPGLPRRLQLGLRRNRREAGVAAICALVLLAVALAWWRQPGTLELTPSPAEAQVRINGNMQPLQNGQLRLSLPPGVAQLEVSAPGYETESREVLIPRGGARELALHLRHATGTLEAAAFPAGAEMILDGVTQGSRIAPRAVDSGPHVLTAFAPDRFEISRRFDLARGTLVREHFTLDQSVLWRKRNPAFQGGLVVIPDVDGDGVGEIVHNELDRLVVFASADGRELGQRFMAGNNRRNFLSLDLGGKLGRVIVSGEDGSDPDLLFLTCDVHLDNVAAFRAFAPSDHSEGFTFHTATDWDGDGVLEVAVGAHDGLHLLDVARGQEIKHLPLPAGLGTPTLHACAGKTCLWSARHNAALTVGLADMATGKMRWQAEVGASDGVLTADLTGDGAADALVFDAKGWRVLDGKTGAACGQGTWPFALGGAPALVMRKNGPLLLALPKDPAQPTCALNPLTSAEIWRGPTGALAVQPWAGTVRQDGLLPLACDQALQLLDPNTGAPVAQVPGQTECVFEPGSGSIDAYLALLRGNRLVALDAHGTLQWAMRLEEAGRPVALLPNASGPGRVVLLAHAANLAVAREPLLRWFDRAVAPLQAGPQVIGRRVIQLGHGQDHADMRAFDGGDGTLAWASQVQVAPNIGPTVADLLGSGQAQVISVGRAPGESTDALLALRAEDGTLAAKWPLPGAASWMACAPAVGDLDGDGHADAVVMRWDGQDVVALRGPAGGVLWQRKLDVPMMGAPIIADLAQDLRAVLVPGRNGVLYALAGKDGSVLWQTRLTAPLESAPQVLDLNGKRWVLQSDLSGGLCVMEAQTGKVRWQIQGASGVAVHGHPAVCRLGNRLLILAPMGSAGLSAFDADTHALVWRLPAPVGTTPALADFNGDGVPEVVAADADGNVWIANAATGQVRWQAQVCGQVEADPAVADLDGDGKPEILVADMDGNLRVVNGKRVKLAPKVAP